jgi:hypothetical protein
MGFNVEPLTFYPIYATINGLTALLLVFCSIGYKKAENENYMRI